jgi:pyruvate,water dikinase
MTRNYFVKISGNVNKNVIGNKGRNLNVLLKSGFKVPKTYCLTTKAYECFINKNDLRQIINETLQDKKHTDKDKSNKIISSILSQKIPQEILAELTDHDFFNKQNLKWAIRSSSNLEDLSEASFAGLYDSYLNIKDLENILDSIKKCWASLWNERAIVYRENNNLSHLQVSMAVLIQEMVNSRYAGVIFTKNPEHKNQDEILLEYCEGVGDRLVSGEITPYSCKIDKSSLKIYHEKTPERIIIADDDIRKLSKLAVKIEAHFGCPQDIEWASDDKMFYILQTRPILSKVKLAEDSIDSIWTRANVGEVLPNVITPLTWDVFQAMLTNRPDLISDQVEDSDLVNEGVKRIYGRVYIRLDHFLNSFCYLPFVTPKAMNRVLGVKLPPWMQAYKSPNGFLIKLAQGAFILEVLGFSSRLQRLFKRLPILPAGNIERLEEIVKWNARCFLLHLKCTAYAIGAFSSITHYLGCRLSLDIETLPEILTGHENLQTASQGIFLWQLAEHVRAHSALRDILDNDYFKWPDSAGRFCSVNGGSQFLAMFKAFLDANGARAAGEFELAVPRWREDPTFVLGLIRKFLYVNTTEPISGDPAIRDRRRQSAISQIKKSLRPFQQKVFDRLLSSYSNFSTLRENVKYRLMEGYALLRQVFLQAGTNLAARCIIEKAEDVFFLRPMEILALWSGKELKRQATGLIAERKAQHDLWEAKEAPDLIIGDRDITADVQGDLLYGIGCSPGIADGLARVLFDISEADTLKPGEILVTPYTDPGWTPLFLNCKAIVTEIGGFLSHGATVAREYGIPAVVNVTGATTKIHTGDLIRVDGLNNQVILGKQTNKKF